MTSGDTHSRKLYSAPNSLNSHPPVFAEDLASWQRSLRAQRKSQKTIETYMHGMSSFLRWCAKNGEDPRLDHVLIQRWISDLLVNREATTARTYQHSVVAFGNWMVAEGEIDTNPLARGKLPRLDAKIVQPLTDQQLQALFNACKGREFIDLRDLAALRLLADTAVRASELLGFNREHLDLDACTGTVICGKGGNASRHFRPNRSMTTRMLPRMIRAPAPRNARALSASSIYTPDASGSTIRTRSRRSA